jgi:hypothetical protein
MSEDAGLLLNLFNDEAAWQRHQRRDGVFIGPMRDGAEVHPESAELLGSEVALVVRRQLIDDGWGSTPAGRRRA